MKPNKERQAGTEVESSTTADNIPSASIAANPMLAAVLPRPTDNVELLVDPFGKYEVDVVSDDGKTLYLVDNCGTIICDYKQVRLLKK